MKDYITEVKNGQRSARSHTKAKSLDNLRARLIRDGILARNEMVIIFTTKADTVKPDTPFRKTGVIWLDGYNHQYFWMANDGIVKNVNEKSGKISAFKVGVQ